jgi:hypothetical protein
MRLAVAGNCLRAISCNPLVPTVIPLILTARKKVFCNFAKLFNFFEAGRLAKKKL